MRLKIISFGHFVVSLLCRNKKQKDEKMILKLDGSEASMLPILMNSSHCLLSTSATSVINIQEFSVGRGIADLFAIESDTCQLTRRKRLYPKALLSTTSIKEHADCHNISSANIIKKSVAIEAKVRDWRKGLKQAMRYKSFADKSYLAVYDEFIDVPLGHLDVFRALNIGLLGVSDSAVNVYYEPNANQLDYDKYLLASERAFSIIDDAQDSFVARNQFATNSISA